MDCSVNDRLFTNSLRLTSGVASLQRMESEEELSTRTPRSSATCAPRMESSGVGVAKHISTWNDVWSNIVKKCLYTSTQVKK